jgi:hypothetical protein
VEYSIVFRMPFLSRRRTPFLTAGLLVGGVLLQGCSCGTERSELAKTFDLTKTFPGASYVSQTVPVRTLRCDSSRVCTLHFRDGNDTTVTWTVKFALDSVSTLSDTKLRRL